MSSKKNEPQDAGASMRNPVEFREWFKILFRVWRPHLSPNQFLTVLFIFDRTAAWGKEWEAITRRQFLTGVVGRNDSAVYASGLRMSAPTLILCLRALIEVGAIKTRAVGRRTAYALEYEWNPEQLSQPEDPDTMSLAKPKRLQGLQSPKTSPNGKETLPSEGKETLPSKGKETLPYKNGKKKCFAESKGNPTDSRRAGPETEDEPTLSDRFAATRQHSASRRKAKVTAWSTASAIPAWSDLCRQHQPDMSHLAVTKTDGVVLHRYGKRWMDTGLDSAAWLEYLGWLIMRWSAIRAEKFAWMKTTSPGVPSIRFLVRFSDVFEQAYASRASIERTASMTPREREIERMVGRGTDREVAERDVDAKLGLTKEREALTRAAAELRKQREGIKRDSATADEAAVRNARWKQVRKSRLDLSEGTHDAWK